jgi:hypothetical protein
MREGIGMTGKRGGVVVPWRETEDAVIREFYPDGGYRACQPFLEGRNRGAIEQRAFRLGATRYEIGKNRAKAEPEYIWPRDPAERAADLAADLALRQFRECRPAANLCWSLGVCA